MTAPVGSSARQTTVSPWALTALALGALLPSLSTSGANTALPTLAQAFHAPISHVQWVVLAYLLAITTLSVAVGRLGDMIGRRRLLLAGTFFYTLASVASSAAPTLAFLIAARAAQGVGAAIMLALTVAILSETVPKDRLGRAMGLLGTVTAVGTAAGPSLGGALITLAGWPAVFLIHLPLGILSIVLVSRFLPVDAAKAWNRVPFDHLGTALLALALGAYALATTTRGGQFGLLNATFLVVSVIGVTLFIVVEKRAVSPLVQFSLFSHPIFSTAFITNALVTAVVMATLVIGPFYLTGALSAGAARVGLVMSMGPLVAALTGVPAGRVVDRFGPHRAALTGLFSMGAGTFLLSTLPTSLGIPGYVVPLVILTAGYALFQAANSTAAMTSIRPDQRGVVSGLMSLSRNLGLITGTSVMGAVYTAGAGHAVTSSAGAVEGLRLTFGVALLLIVGALITAFISRSRSRKDLTSANA